MVDGSGAGGRFGGTMLHRALWRSSNEEPYACVLVGPTALLASGLNCYLTRKNFIRGGGSDSDVYHTWYSSEYFPPLSSCDIHDSQLVWKISRTPPPPHLSLHRLHFLSLARESAVAMWPFGTKPHLFVNYPININRPEEAFVSPPRAGDVSWHHHAADDWWKTLRSYFMLCHFRGEWGCN